MNQSNQNATGRRRRWIVGLCVLAGLAGAVWTQRESVQWAGRWMNQRFFAAPSPSSGQAEHHDHDDHEGHSHGASTESIDLSYESLRNLGLDESTLKPVVLSDYLKSISVPAIVVERPGRTTIDLSTPMTGVVTEVEAVEGSAVGPGEKLFQIRLTHEDLVQTQTDFVRSLGELDVENREIKRLEGVTESGAISGKSLLERRYAKEKLEALIQSQREALRLHGLSLRQVDQMSTDRRLLSELSILSPSSTSREELQLTRSGDTEPISFLEEPDQAGDGNPAKAETLPLIIESLRVRRGQSVEQGASLCTLANYAQLHFEGHAFEQDVEAINRAVSNRWPITALLPGGEALPGLSLAFVASEIDPETRTLNFYVDLKNEVLRDTRNAEGQRFLTWRFKPGQRAQLQVPIESWKDRIVLPLAAVARDGVESYVYRKSGKYKFQQVPVHELSRDQTAVVVSAEGKLHPGDVIAWRSAHQLRLAIKNQSGGGVDPHAGHTH